ncbi:hypothetical protein N7520_007806 [Penicillium odoratum]|uniref:uncharacterized protein n=1 Tax=Penicillium odoratum TaxID=1167516 RepID=UPI002549A2D5|nr:uncharacterized protein N7520_007806 [Penicillium odoratum]KAJ5760650.1 hypothetical protein N7520_007806 [Penicillium odoratum]
MNSSRKATGSSEGIMGIESETESYSLDQAELMSQFSLTPASNKVESDGESESTSGASVADSNARLLEDEQQFQTQRQRDAFAFSREDYPPKNKANHPSLGSTWTEYKSIFLKSDNLDFALIPIDTKDHIAGLPVLSQETIGSPKIAAVEVMAMTGSGCALTGEMSSRRSTMRLPKSLVYTEVLSVKFRGSLQHGDCGSLVRDATTGIIYGHIIAGDTVSQTAFIIPANDTVEYAVKRYKEIEGALSNLSPSLTHDNTGQKSTEATSKLCGSEDQQGLNEFDFLAELGLEDELDFFFSKPPENAYYFPTELKFQDDDSTEYSDRWPTSESSCVTSTTGNTSIPEPMTSEFIQNHHILQQNPVPWEMQNPVPWIRQNNPTRKRTPVLGLPAHRSEPYPFDKDTLHEEMNEVLGALTDQSSLQDEYNDRELGKALNHLKQWTHVIKEKIKSAKNRVSKNKQPEAALPTPGFPLWKKFRCRVPGCRATMSTAGAFQRHVEYVHHPRFSFDCLKCDLSGIPRRDKLRSHCQTVHLWRPSSEEVDEMSKALNSPSHCSLCEKSVTDWDNFYRCFKSHCRGSSITEEEQESSDEDISTRQGLGEVEMPPTQGFDTYTDVSVQDWHPFFPHAELGFHYQSWTAPKEPTEDIQHSQDRVSRKLLWY